MKRLCILLACLAMVGCGKDKARQKVWVEPISAICLECSEEDFRSNMMDFSANIYLGANGWKVERVYSDTFVWSKGRIIQYRENGEKIWVHKSCNTLKECDCHGGWRSKNPPVVDDYDPLGVSKGVWIVTDDMLGIGTNYCVATTNNCVATTKED